MRASAECIAMIKRLEGLRLQAYRCSANTVTIGYGHTGINVTIGMSITEEQAEVFFRQDLAQFETAVNSLVKIPLNQNQFDALVSWTYNLGPGNLRTSTLLQVLNAGKYAEVPAQMMRWIYANKVVNSGLVRRREEEARLFTSVVSMVPSLQARPKM